MRWIFVRVVVCAAFLAPAVCCRATAPDIEPSTGSEFLVDEPSTPPKVSLKPCSPIPIYRDGRLTLHTDLEPDAAQATLAKMKEALRFAEKHWRRRLRGSLDCYVAADTSRWPDKAFPHPLARVWIDCIGGATVCEPLPASRRGHLKATVYASTRRGAAPHEIVHAYCSQTFAHVGPDWYNEGVAMVVGYHGHDDQGVQCPLEVLTNLRQGSPQTVRQMFQPTSFTSTTYDSLALMVESRKNPQGQVSKNCWTSADAKNLVVMCKAYGRSWSLCYLLLHDPNYQSQFRRLGNAYLAGQRPSYHQAFGAMHKELAFDYKAFLQHVDTGYRVDLCSWEWHKRFRELEQSNSRSRSIQAARGYQATGVMVARGQYYDYEAHGHWSTSTTASSTNADGDADGEGRLEAVVMHDYQLSAPFELGTSGSFTPPTSGRLYVRCRDSWNQLADNRGTLQVAFSRSNGKP